MTATSEPQTRWGRREPWCFARFFPMLSIAEATHWIRCAWNVPVRYCECFQVSCGIVESTSICFPICFHASVAVLRVDCEYRSCSATTLYHCGESSRKTSWKKRPRHFRGLHRHSQRGLWRFATWAPGMPRDMHRRFRLHRS